MGSIWDSLDDAFKALQDAVVEVRRARDEPYAPSPERPSGALVPRIVD